MIKSVEIFDYRSCRNVRLGDLGSLTAFIGRNGAGKTNLLKAIEWIARIGCGRAYPASGDLFANTTTGHAKLRFQVGAHLYEYTVKRGYEFDHVRKLQVVRTIFTEELVRLSSICVRLLSRDGGVVTLHEAPPRTIKMALETSAIPGLLALIADENELRGELQSISHFLHGVTYYPLDVQQDARADLYFVRAADFGKWSAMHDKSQSTAENTVMKILALYVERRAEFDELMSLVGDHGLGLIEYVDVREVLTPVTSDNPMDSPSYFVTFAPLGARQPLPFSGLSFGTKRILQLLTALIFDPISVALIEQPEDGLHPGLLHKVTPLLRDYADGSQFIVASHSPTVLNRLRPEELRIIRTESGRTVADGLSEDQIANAHLFLEEDGPLADFVESL